MLLQYFYEHYNDDTTKNILINTDLYSYLLPQILYIILNSSVSSSLSCSLLNG